jgi:DNA-binding HxlR family transcriptional regulator
VTKALPKWLENRYAVLWGKFKSIPFSFEEAEKLLREKDPKTLSVVLSDLRNLGWLSVKLDPKTARKRLYQLKPPETALDEIAAEHLKTKPLDEFFYEPE